MSDTREWHHCKLLQLHQRGRGLSYVTMNTANWKLFTNTSMLHFKLTAAVMYHIPNTCSLRGYGHDKTLTNTIQSVTENNTD